MHVNRMAALAGATAMLAVTGPALAAPRAGSVYVQCDGRPNNVTAGETAARLLALTFVVGLLAPQPEAADSSKRLKGEAGIKACTAALEGDGKEKRGEGNEVRRAELALARAVHRIEAGQHDAAIAEARGLSAIAPMAAAETGFKKSLGLSAMEVEAAALVHMGKFAEAEAAALRMAAASPYDVANVSRAETYLKLTDTFGPDKQRYYENAVRLFPIMLTNRAVSRMWAGDFRAAADDYAKLNTLLNLDEPSAPLVAIEAAALMMAGDAAKAEERAAVVRTRLAVMETASDADANRNVLRDTRETMDFYDIARLAAAGRLDEARVRFSSRSSWSSPAMAMIAALTARLRTGATPAQLTGALAIDPAELKSKELATRLSALKDEKKQAARLYALRTYRKPGAGAAYGRKVWKVDKSKYLVAAKPKEGAKPPKFDFIMMNDIGGELGGEALLLHAALLAQKKGKSGFALYPIRLGINQAGVIFGNRNDPGVPADLHFDAAQVIAALSPELPKPAEG